MFNNKYNTININYNKKFYLDNYKDICVSAAQGGQLDVLNWIRKQTNQKPEFEIDIWNESICSNAAYGGHLHVLKWLRDPTQFDGQVCPWDQKTCFLAAHMGELDVLKWLRNPIIHNTQGGPCPWNELVSMGAAECGQIEVLKWLLTRISQRDIALYLQMYLRYSMLIKGLLNVSMSQISCLLIN